MQRRGAMESAASAFRRIFPIVLRISLHNSCTDLTEFRIPLASNVEETTLLCFSFFKEMNQVDFEKS